MEIVETLKKGFTKPGKWLIPLLGIWILYACTMEDETSYQGTLSLELVSDTTLMKSRTKASGTSIWDLSDFSKTADYTVEILQGTTSVQKYDRYDKMPDEVSLKPGDYTLLVSKGKNEPAAFSSPYFEGKQDFSIVDGMTTPVTVTASMANSRVTVDFSDDFLETYKSYTLSFMTNKMKVPLVYELGSAMYFQSDAAGTKLTIAMQLVNVYGKEIEYNATTTIKPKQWAKLTIRTDEKGLNGVAIDVVLNDETKETVYVNIGIPDFMEKLKGAPYINCGVFHWNDTNIDEGLDGSCCCDKGECANSASVDITAGGKINQVLLTLTDEAKNVLINQYDLVNLTPEQAKDLKENYDFVMPEGSIKGKVFTTIDFKSIVSSLLGKAEDSHYILSLTVVDALPEAKKTTKSVKIKVSAAGASSINWDEFPNGTEHEYGTFAKDQNVEINVPAGIKAATISIDGLGITDQDINTPIDGITVKKEANKVTLTFTQGWFNSLLYNETDASPKKYTVTLNVTDNLDRTIEDKLRSFTVKAPVFEWSMAENEGDVFATYAFLRVKATDVSKVTFYQNGAQITSNIQSLGRDESTGIATFVWKGLEPNTAYDNVTAKYDGKLELGSQSFTTENVVQLPNNEFSNWEVQDWTYKVTLKGNRTDSNYNFILDSWGTNNNETLLYEVTDIYVIWKVAEFSQKLFPTVTYADEGKDFKSAVIRSVSANTLNTNEIMKDAVAGRISYVGDLNARPSSLSYTYKYDPYSEDKYKVLVKIVGENGTILVEEPYVPESSVRNDTFETITIPFDYSSLEEKAQSIEVYFYSSESGTPVTEKNRMVTLPAPNGNTYKTHTGSVLTIDNVILNYDYE